jgi:hypothetical protein
MMMNDGWMTLVTVYYLYLVIGSAACAACCMLHLLVGRATRGIYFLFRSRTQGPQAH